MSYSLDRQRVLFGVTCDTASDVVLALQMVRGEGQEELLATLKDAIDNADEDIICGHVDLLRSQVGEPFMDSRTRYEAMAFYRSFISENPTSTDRRPIAN